MTPPAPGLTVLTPLRLERRAVRAGAATARVVVTGAGPARSRRFRAGLNGEGNGNSHGNANAPGAANGNGHRGVGNGAIAVAGFAGALDPELQPGDLVVATEVRLATGTVHTFPGARLLAGELRRAGLRAVAGPIRSVERLVRGSARAELAADGAVAADMESAWLLDGHPDRAAAVVRAIVDTSHRELVSPWTPLGTWRAAQSLRAAVPVLERWAAAVSSRRVVLAAPRGFCAGVDRAIDIVERAIERYGPPVYVRRQIIHNVHVVADLAGRGAVFVDELSEVPDGGRVVFAAHGVAPAVREAAAARSLSTIDATCPLVAKVHTEVRRFAGRGFKVVLIGHADHEEVQGTIGEAPDAVEIVGNADDVAALDVADPNRVAYVTQTTLAVDDVAEIVDRLRDRFPNLAAPPRDDICYATQNRQDAARVLARQCDVVLVVGSRNSSNSNRLVEVVRREGCQAHLLDDDSELELAWVSGATTVGITAGASAPESMVQRVVVALGSLGPVAVEEQRVIEEDVHFTLPAEVR